MSHETGRQSKAKKEEHQTNWRASCQETPIGDRKKIKRRKGQFGGERTWAEEERENMRDRGQETLGLQLHLTFLHAI